MTQDELLGAAANDTPVQTPTGFVPINQIAIGDQVLAVVDYTTGGPLKWAPLTVAFSEGTAPGSNQPMVFLGWSDQQVVVTPDQLIMLADGKLVTIAQLTVGSAVATVNGAVRLDIVAFGVYHGGVHDIATSAPYDGTPNGHLLNIGGLVMGDFVLQMKWPTRQP